MVKKFMKLESFEMAIATVEFRGQRPKGGNKSSPLVVRYKEGLRVFLE